MRHRPAPATTVARVRVPWRALVLQSMAVALVMTWPIVLHPAAAAIGSSDTDTAKHVWNLWWMRHEALHGPWGLWTRSVNWPVGLALYPIEPLHGLVALLLPVSPVLLSNLLALVNVTLVGVAGGWLGVEASGRADVAWRAGLLAECGTFVAFSLDVGVGELRQVWWIPLALGFLTRALREGRPGDAVLAGLCVGGAVASAFYLGLFCVVGAIVYGAVAAGRSAEAWRACALAALVAIVPAIVAARLFASTYGGVADAFHEGELAGASASLDELVRPLGALDLAALRAYHGGRYLGLGTLVAAAWAWSVDRRVLLPWLAVAVVAVVLSLGPLLRVAGSVVIVQGVGIQLPARALNALLDGLGEPLNFPSRFCALAGVALAVMASRVPAGRLGDTVVAVAALDLVLLGGIEWPRRTWAPPDMTGLRGGDMGVIDLSALAYSSVPIRNRSIAAQIELRRPFATVPIERVAEWAPEGAAWVRAVQVVDDMLETDVRTPTEDTLVLRRGFWLLRRRGFDRVLVTWPVGAPPERRIALLDHWCGPGQRAPAGGVWTLPQVPAGEEEGERWFTEHEEIIAAGAGASTRAREDAREIAPAR